MTLGELHDHLAGYHFRFSAEEQLQQGIAMALDGIEYRREHVLKRGVRIDFLVEGRLGLEVKVDGSVMAVNRQLQQYAKHEAIEGILLVTSRAKHLQVERELAGTPIMVLCLSMHSL